MNFSKWHIGLAGIGAATLLVGFSSCVSIPKGAKAISPFNKNRYLGQWYEIARMDFKYEKNLDSVTANYSLREDGSIKVVNRGFNYVDKKWKESEGKAKFVKSSDIGRLKVSFFGPFYAGYNVIAIDEDYKYVMVTGNNLDYLWLLSREQTMPPSVISKYLKQAQSLGYAFDKLVWTKHVH